MNAWGDKAVKLATLTVLSELEIRDIHNATLDILGDCGVQVLSPRMLDALKTKGLPVDVNTQTVRFPRAVLEDALALIPQRIEVCDREGRPVFVLGDGVPRIAAGHNAVFWLDSATGINGAHLRGMHLRLPGYGEHGPTLEIFQYD